MSRRGGSFLQAVLLAFLISVMIAVVAVALGVLSPPKKPEPQGVPEMPQDHFVRVDGTRDLRIEPFDLIDQEGRPVDNTIFDGKLTLVDFMFTNCPLVCPQMTGNMIELQKRLADTPVRIVTFSVDPERDTPERLREHTASFADYDRWTFLTGDPEAPRRLAAGLALAYDEDESLQIQLAGGLTMPNIVHPTKFILVGPDRQILALYDGLDRTDVPRMEREIRLVLADVEAGREPGAKPAAAK